MNLGHLKRDKATEKTGHFTDVIRGAMKRDRGNCIRKEIGKRRRRFAHNLPQIPGLAKGKKGPTSKLFVMSCAKKKKGTIKLLKRDL